MPTILHVMGINNIAFTAICGVNQKHNQLWFCVQQVVSGLEPEATNAFLQALAKSVHDKCNTKEAVQKTLGGGGDEKKSRKEDKKEDKHRDKDRDREKGKDKDDKVRRLAPLNDANARPPL